MNRSIEQALASVLPTFNGALPARLVELATSLLAQSRSRASNLKAEEEIARSYACAHIACERLKQTLHLPKITPHPPCPPRVYTKLYKHLENVLLVSKPHRPVPENVSSKSAKSSRLPATPRTSTKSRTSRHGNRTSRKPPSTSPSSVPQWSSPAIQHLALILRAPAAAPPVLNGLTTILTSSSPPFLANTDTPSSAPKKDKLPALLIALFFFTMTRLSGEEMTGKDYVRMRDVALEAVNEFTLDDLADQGDGFEEVQRTDVDAWMKELAERGWLRLKWFEYIWEGSGLGDASDTMPEGERDDVPLAPARRSAGRSPTMVSREKKSVKLGAGKSLQLGLGTMMQERIDYLSDERRAEYADWKEDILARVEEIQRRMATDAAG
ncbi:MAG: hypothetical protein M1837_003206 [Sclerophora amabilis]|nr:MAG: hypothetical protein M1837_003206 [Sclerophora amabilis]